MGKSELDILVLVENKVYSSDLIAEHGLSFYFEYQNRKYLFDTGQGKAIINNAQNLKVDFTELAGVFLSHGHYDHTGGLPKILKSNPNLPVYGHPYIFKRKYSRRKDHFKNTGLSMNREDITCFKSITKLQEITEGIWLTGEIPGRINPDGDHKIETTSQLKDDYFIDDQSLIIETSKGLVVLLGCSHAGVINILEYIQNNFTEKIYAVLGGMHLSKADDKKIEKVIDYLSGLPLELLVPMHCTGIEVVGLMKRKLGNKVKRGYTGERYRI